VIQGSLQAKLESSPPARLPVGVATALFLYGTCFHPDLEVIGLEIVVDGRERHRPAAAGMPRADVYELHGRRPGAYRSGFWGSVPIKRRERAGAVSLALAARLADGREEIAPLADLEVVESAAGPPRAGPAAADVVAVCMATYEPDLGLFRAQVDSLRAQTDSRWLCVISDDCTSEDRFAGMLELISADERFVISRAERRVGFYRNFERALSMAPPESELFALCDQDDRWYPEKLETLRRCLGDAQLVYSDQRLVDARGRVLRETMWKGRANNHTDLAALLTANTITGAATLFRRDVARLALPFPDLPGLQFHDHWVAVVALAAGTVAYVERPLYDYVQHAGAVFGEVAGERAADRVRAARGRFLRGSRGAYFLGYLQREVMAQALLVRCGDVLTPSNRRALERFVRAQNSVLALAWLALRPLRAVAGRTDTLGSELELVRGILWKRAVTLLARVRRVPGRRPPDVTFPEPLAFEQRRLRRWRARA
jgi:glycosyltransferase involved in cell wall biosynthesis